jgi:cyclase
LEWVREVQERGAGELLIQSVDRDGQRHGFDIELIHKVKSSVAIPVIAASGAGSIEDIVKLSREAKPDGVAIASLLHYGLSDIQSIKAALADFKMEVS